jgi:hypothetical protein
VNDELALVGRERFFPLPGSSSGSFCKISSPWQSAKPSKKAGAYAPAYSNAIG